MDIENSKNAHKYRTCLLPDTKNLIMATHKKDMFKQKYYFCHIKGCKQKVKTIHICN
jgi:hypothetical protein